MAAHYCCELGEAALAAKDLDSARAHVASARAHSPMLARATILAARIATAAGETDKALDLYAGALASSRSIEVAFEREAQEALPGRSAALAEKLRSSPGSMRRIPEPARFRCEQCGVDSLTWHWRGPSCRNGFAARQPTLVN